MSYSVASKVKELIKAREMNCAGDFCDALDKHIEQKIDRAVERAKANDRKTVRAADL
ncbi:MAG: DUF1931 domain-containing protein [Candidatus Aenigmarchaeota archaeon]|nr:DUF1931 domain-containing protein [Candidatus Aenigmarchaeota archaeon]